MRRSAGSSFLNDQLNSEHLNEAQLAALVTPEAMMGVALVPSPPAV